MEKERKSKKSKDKTGKSRARQGRRTDARNPTLSRKINFLNAKDIHSEMPLSLDKENLLNVSREIIKKWE